MTRPWPFFAALSLLSCDEAPVRYMRAELDGVPVKWMTGKLTLYVQDPPAQSNVSREAFLNAVSSAVHRWQGECRAFEVEVLPTTSRVGAARDSVNVVSIQHDRWCPPGTRSKSDCYDPRLEALTHLYKGAGREGSAALIEEADIELNGVDHTFSLSNLEPILVHEMGHFLGLRHACSVAKFTETSGLRPCEADAALAMHPDPPARQGLLVPAESELRFVCDVYGGERQSGLLRLAPWLVAAIATVLASVGWIRIYRRSARAVP